MRVLITGVGVFIGSYLLAECLRRGYSIRGFFRQAEDTSQAELLGAEIRYGNITNPDFLIDINSIRKLIYKELNERANSQFDVYIYLHLQLITAELYII